uniref:Interleukin 1 receptor like 2 n=1 Tax=Gopherus evgoodei TaxID=1825980 RepID=A0A8C5F1P1_9SAUR
MKNKNGSPAVGICPYLKVQHAEHRIFHFSCLATSTTSFEYDYVVSSSLKMNNIDKILNFENTDYNLTWYKTGSQTSVAKDQHSRIHQQNNFIWFLPATLEDSGSYECVIRNLSSCRKVYMNLRVFKNIYGLCFNEKFAIGEEILTSSHAKVVCPHLDYFRDEENTLPLQWYKECELLEEERFVSSNDYLVIKNATLHDKGNYTCRTSYTYKGKQYNISRDISLTVTGICLLFFMSLHFKNTIQILMDCNVTGAEVFQVYWTVNNTYIDLYYKRVSCSFFIASDGKIYDAYVMYPKPNGVRCIYTLNNFVLRILPEVLEIQCGYNLFILGRDDLLGEAVVNVIDETIKQSRRLMIILESEALSYNVLEDTFEQQLAVYNALIRDEIKIILIELDKIQDNTNMPESIKYIKQKHGAIRWKGDFTEKSHSANTKFWKNVRYQMPLRQTVSSLDPKTFHYFAATER